MSDTKKKKRTVSVPCDTGRLYGPLKEAASYLLEVAEKHPEAELKECWSGHEDMEMVFSWRRYETDDEHQDRVERETRDAEYKAELRREKLERENDFMELARLKAKLGVR